MEQAAAGLETGILTLLGVVHVYWSLGGTAGKSAAVPQRNGRQAFTPSPAGTLLVAACLFAAAYCVAATGGLIPSPSVRISGWATAGLAVLFSARAIGDFRLVGFFKRPSTSAFAKLDNRIYSPLCLILAALSAYVAHGHR
jgi:hypothetical protein